ncbi:hypothetical protein EP7_000028 [Isosphaeraceae bacterium EP7]
MIRLHPESLTKNGKKEFAVLPYEEFVALLELLEDAADVLDLRPAKGDEADAATLSLDEAKKTLGLD